VKRIKIKGDEEEGELFNNFKRKGPLRKKKTSGLVEGGKRPNFFDSLSDLRGWQVWEKRFGSDFWRVSYAWADEKKKREGGTVDKRGGGKLTKQ